jgi:hypothetical protein
MFPVFFFMRWFFPQCGLDGTMDHRLFQRPVMNVETFRGKGPLSFCCLCGKTQAVPFQNRTFTTDCQRFIWL